MSITYLQGDATRPVLQPGDNFIIHICNMEGGWGRGFVKALSRRWTIPEACYRAWHRDRTDRFGGPFALGNIQPLRVEHDIIVINMLAQKFWSNDGIHALDEIPLSYEALACCLSKVRAHAEKPDRFGGRVTIHGPKFGSGLAGGDWPRIEKLVSSILKAFPVYIYELEKK